MIDYITPWACLVGLVGIVIFSIGMVEFRELACVTLFGWQNKAPANGTGSFDPIRDIPSLAGKVILVTGAAGIRN